MAEAFYLSRDDAKLFKELVTWYKQSKPDLISRVHTGQHFGENEDHQAPEVYVARVPAGGIPPLGWVIGDPDRPGSATCNIFKLSGSSLVPVGISKVVKNLSLSTVDAPYVLIQRDKFGTWYVDCPCGLEPPTGTGTGTGTGSTGTGSEVGTGSGTTGTGSDALSCCAQLPTTLSATVWFDEVTGGGLCSEYTLTLVKSGTEWTGVVTGWCSSPSSFQVKLVCETSPLVYINGSAAFADTSSCPPLFLQGTATSVIDSSCCESSPSLLNWKIEQ